jgi:hypothetical protein
METLEQKVYDLLNLNTENDIRLTKNYLITKGYKRKDIKLLFRQYVLDYIQKSIKHNDHLVNAEGCCIFFYDVFTLEFYIGNTRLHISCIITLNKPNYFFSKLTNSDIKKTARKQFDNNLNNFINQLVSWMYKH